MKKDNPEHDQNLQIEATDQPAAVKKKTKTAGAEDQVKKVAKVKKSKAEKGEKNLEVPVQKESKAAKEDKLTKFLVSMKKSVRKAIKKEAAELGISMNDYIVGAVGAKLGLTATKATPKASKKG